MLTRMCAHRQIKLCVCVCVSLFEATGFVDVYQSILVIDKIPQFFNLGDLGTSVAAVERVRLNCVHVPVAHPGGSRTIELSLCSHPSFPPSSIKRHRGPGL